MGWTYAGIRVLILGFITLLLVTTTMDFWYRGLNFVMPYLAIIFLLSLIIIFNLIRALLGGPFRAVKAFCNQSDNPEEMMQRLQKAWDEGFATLNCLIDDEYFIWARKFDAVVIPLKDIYGINFMVGLFWGAGNLQIYLKNNTMITLSVRHQQEKEVIEHINQHQKGILTGADASSRLLELLVGTINTRYYIVKVQSKYYIVDYTNPSKLLSYLSFGNKYRFSTSKPKGFWRAWEVSEQELQNIKYIPYQEAKSLSSGISSLLFGIGMIGVIFLARVHVMAMFPVNDLFNGQGWIVALAIASIILICAFRVIIASRFDTTRYTEVYIQKNKVTYTKTQFFLYIIARTTSLVVPLYFLIDMFSWNTGLIPYIFLVCIFLCCIFFGLLAGTPNIDPQSNIQKANDMKKKSDSKY